MADILHRMEVGATPAIAYRALARPTEVARWWTCDVAGPGTVGSVLEFGFFDHTVVIGMEVVELVADRAVRWKCVAGPDEWIGTEVKFSLTPSGVASVLHFSHLGWKQPSDRFVHSNTQWAVFLLSLKALLESGRGTPHPEALMI